MLAFVDRHMQGNEGKNETPLPFEKGRGLR